MVKHAVFAFGRRHWATALFLILGCGLLGWMTWQAVSVRAITYDARSDYWEHSAVLHALIQSPWHPKNPHLVSSASSPRFGPQFIFVALLARAFHLDAIAAMSLTAVLNTLLFLIGIRYFFVSYFRDERAALYGLVVMFCSWWHAWNYSNVYQLNVLFGVASYPSTTALALTLVGFGYAVRTLRGEGDQPRFALALLVVWAFAVFVIHQLTAMMSLSGLLLLAVCQPNVKLRLRAEVMATVLVGCALARIWPYFSAWEVLAGGKSDAAHWVDQGIQQAVALEVKTKRHLFYRESGILNALGLSLLSVLALPYFLLRRERWFVSLGALSMLLPFIVNAYVELPLGHRFILLAIFYLQVGVVWLLLLVTPGYESALPILRRRGVAIAAACTVALVLAVFAVHNVVLANSQLDAGKYEGRTESPLVHEMRAVAQAAGPNAVVLTTAALSWPLPTFGPKVLVTLHPNPLVPDEPEREASVARFLSPRASDEERLQILTRYGVTHVLLARETGGPLGRFLGERSTRSAIGGLRLYALGPLNATH